MLADAATGLAASRALYRQAAGRRDDDLPYSTEAAMAKLCATDTTMSVTTDAVQVLGGAGYVEDYPVERYMREAKVLQIVEGTNQVQRLVIGRALLGAPATATANSDSAPGRGGRAAEEDRSRAGHDRPPGDGTRRTLYLGGAVYCADEPFATAMLVSDGSSRGSAPTVPRAFSDDADDVVDLGGALVTPAFVDAHVHTTAGGMVGVGLDLTRAASKAAVLNAVATAARGRKQTELIVGFGWDEREWPDPSPPTRSELDVAGGGAPVFLDRIDVHSSAVSSALVDRVPQVRERFGFTADGVLTDLAHHTARAAVSDLLPDEVRLAAQRKVRAQAAALGIGQIHEMGGPDPPAPKTCRRCCTWQPLSLAPMWWRIGPRKGRSTTCRIRGWSGWPATCSPMALSAPAPPRCESPMRTARAAATST